MVQSEDNIIPLPVADKENDMNWGSQKVLTRAAMFAVLATSQSLFAAELTPADYAAIQQLYAQYNTTIDRGDAAGWAATFTPDGVFMNNKGSDALKKFVVNWSAGQGASQRHFSADVVITPSAEGATGSASTLLVNLASKPISIGAYVTYSDVIVKTPAGWRFKSRALKVETAPAAATAAPAAAPAKPAGQ